METVISAVVRSWALKISEGVSERTRWVGNRSALTSSFIPLWRSLNSLIELRGFEISAMYGLTPPARNRRRSCIVPTFLSEVANKAPNCLEFKILCRCKAAKKSKSLGINLLTEQLFVGIAPIIPETPLTNGLGVHITFKESNMNPDYANKRRSLKRQRKLTDIGLLRNPGRWLDRTPEVLR